jgi:hypothetical protein
VDVVFVPLAHRLAGEAVIVVGGGKLRLMMRVIGRQEPGGFMEMVYVPATEVLRVWLLLAPVGPDHE